MLLPDSRGFSFDASGRAFIRVQHPYAMTLEDVCHEIEAIARVPCRAIVVGYKVDIWLGTTNESHEPGCSYVLAFAMLSLICALLAVLT